MKVQFSIAALTGCNLHLHISCRRRRREVQVVSHVPANEFEWKTFYEEMSKLEYRIGMLSPERGGNYIGREDVLDLLLS